MSNQAVEVEILGKLTRVNCPPEHRETLKLAAKELDARLSAMAQRTKIANIEKLLTFAALNACAELQELQSTTDELTIAKERLELLNSKLDSALSPMQGQQE